MNAPERYVPIPDLDIIGFKSGGFGSVSEKKERKLRVKLAAEMLDRGEPFIFDGRLIPARETLE